MLYYAEYREGIGTAELICDISQVDTQGPTWFAVRGSSVAPLAPSLIAKEPKQTSLSFSVDCNTQMPSAKDVGQGMVSVHFPRQTVTAMPLSYGAARGHSNRKEFVSWAAASEAFPYTLQCAFCQNTVSRERSIAQRTFPLPSEEFRGMVSELFCHGSSSAAQRFMAEELVPREEECLLSESCIVFRLTSLLQESLLLEEEVQQHFDSTNPATNTPAHPEYNPGTNTDTLSETPVEPQDTHSADRDSPSETPAEPEDARSMDRDTPPETPGTPPDTLSTNKETPSETPGTPPDTLSTNKEPPSEAPSASSNSSPSKHKYNVRCSRCFSHLGQGRALNPSPTDCSQEEPVTSVTFQWENVTLQTKGFHPVGGKVCPVLERVELETDFAHKLTALAGSSGMYRFLLKDPTGRVYACIWHINSNVHIATNALSASRSAFEGYSGWAFGKQGSDAVQACASDNDAAGDVPNTECFRAMKLLYKSCLKDAEESGTSTAASWEVDGSVTDMVFSLVDCLQVLLVLEENNLSLPPTMRIANTFNIAYFKCNTP